MFILGSGFDVIEDFRGDQNDKIAITNSMNYLIMQDDFDLQISTEIGVTVLHNVELSTLIRNVNRYDLIFGYLLMVLSLVLIRIN